MVTNKLFNQEGIIYKLTYDPINRVFLDDDFKIVKNIYDYLDDNEIYLFRIHQEDMFIFKKRCYIELIWPDYCE